MSWSSCAYSAVTCPPQPVFGRRERQQRARIRCCREQPLGMTGRDHAVGIAVRDHHRHAHQRHAGQRVEPDAGNPAHRQPWVALGRRIGNGSEGTEQHQGSGGSDANPHGSFQRHRQRDLGERTRVLWCAGKREISMTRILGISGSLRAASYNTALLRAAQQLAGADIGLTIATLHGIPVYDGDLEQRDGIPPAVQALKQQVMASDGVLLATPEYNNGVPGVLKNAIDWMSRPSSDAAAVFGDRPFAVMGASPGGFGTILAQVAWLPILRTLGARFWSGGRLQVSRAGQAFDAEGNLVDERVADQLRAFMQGFAAFAAGR
jgi:NAD(P)H-dependent FMN reductase